MPGARVILPNGSYIHFVRTSGTNRRSSMTVAGPPVMNYTYDNANRLTHITQDTSTVTMAYDNVGRRTSLTLPTGTSITYTYDAASQLTALSYRQGANILGTLTYTYDNNGNRLKQSGTWACTGLPQPRGTVTVNANNQMLTFGNTTLMYDFNGNITTRLGRRRTPGMRTIG